jgi:hypothetical protein
VIDKLVYLARPIDKTGEHETLISVACSYIRDILVTCNPRFFIFDPGGGCYALNQFGNDGSIPINDLAETLRHTNEAIIQMSNLVIALYLTKVPTVGVITEIDFCHRERVPLVIITDEQPGMYMLGMVRHPEQIVVCTEFADMSTVHQVDHPDSYRFIAAAIEASLTVGLERLHG